MNNTIQFNFKENYIWYSLILLVIIIILSQQNSNTEGFENDPVQVCLHNTNGKVDCYKDIKAIIWKSNNANGDTRFTNNQFSDTEVAAEGHVSAVQPSVVSQEDQQNDLDRMIETFNKETIELKNKWTNRYPKELINSLVSARNAGIAYIKEHKKTTNT